MNIQLHEQAQVVRSNRNSIHLFYLAHGGKAFRRGTGKSILRSAGKTCGSIGQGDPVWQL